MIYSFADFTLDDEAGELYRNNAPLEIEPQVFDLIRLLVASAGRTVSRDEIFEAIWGDRVVSDAALSSRVRDARRVLGDSGKEQAFIKTLHRRGLKFVAPVKANGAAAPDIVTNLPDLHDKPSIAVLPFRALGEDADDAFFATGLTEDITANLARFRGLMVISRATSQAYAESDPSPTDLHNGLGVDLVLQGSLQRSSDRLRVRMQLTDAASGVTLLSEQFDRPFAPESQFDIQDEVAGLVAARVGDLYGPTGHTLKLLSRKARSSSFSTIVCIARYHDYATDRNPALHGPLMADLQACLKEDPSSSDGWAALAILKIEEFRQPFHPEPMYSLTEEALEHARRAVYLDASNDLAALALALAYFYRREMSEFEAASERAIAANPNNAILLAEIGLCHLFYGNYEKAMSLGIRAIALSPVHPGWFRMTTACSLFMSGDTESALAEQLKTPNPGFLYYHAHLASYYGHLGKGDKAASEMRNTLMILPTFEQQIFKEGYVVGVGKEFFDRLADGWRKAGFALADLEYDDIYA